MTEQNYFVELNKIDVSSKVKKRGKYDYLSWAWAWKKLKRYPETTYTVYENKNGFPYLTDGQTALVKVGVTVKGIEHIEYLPVMDFRNQSIRIENMTSMDINKAIQRALTKAIARHGLGLNLYQGEDLPDEENEQKSSGRSYSSTSSTMRRA